MKIIIEILKGAMIGIANIIPGLSGGTLAVVMNIYDKLITALSDILKSPIKAIKSVWIYLVGIGVGIVFGVFAITFLLEKFEAPTTALFVGLIIGAIPLLLKQVENKKVTKSNIIISVVMALIVISLPFLSMIGIDSNVENPVIYFFLGAISAGTMVVPGVSGSMVLMTLGYYDKVMELIKETINALAGFEFDIVLNNLIHILPFGLGVVLGIILIAKFIKWLFEKHKQLTIFAILGLVIASPFAVIVEMSITSIDIITIIVSVISLVVGYKIADYFGKMEE